MVVDPKMWGFVPTEIKEPESLYAFRFKIKKGGSLKDVLTKVCKRCVRQVGFIIGYFGSCLSCPACYCN